MKARGVIGDWIAGIFLVTVVYVLVRPRSAAASAVDSFSKAMAAIVRNVTDM